MADITRLSCNSINIENIDPVEELTFEVEELQDDQSFEQIVAPTTVLPLEDIDYTFPNDGVFKLTIIVGGITTTIYNHFIYCDIQACMLNLIGEVMQDNAVCECDCFDIHNKKYYLYNSIKMSFFTLLSTLNTQYVDNEVYTTLDPHDLEDLYFISELIDRMTYYCSCASELSTPNCQCK